MPRYHPLPPPEPGALEGLPLHVLVRDWPELLVVLRQGGVDLLAEGGVSLSERDRDAPRPPTRALQEATAWRHPRRSVGDPGGSG